MTVPDDDAIGVAPEALNVPVDVKVVNADAGAAASGRNMKS
jgi:hypothetical protein